MNKAIDIIEPAKSYYLLPADHVSKPMLVGGRIKLGYALAGVDKDMIIATSGNDKRCVILVDFTPDEAWKLIQKADMKMLKLKAKN